MSSPTAALANGTYTISSFMGNDTYYLSFLDGENGVPLRGRNYTGSDAFHWDITPARAPLQYSIRNRLFKKDVAFTNPLQPYSILEVGDGPQFWWITPIEDNMYMIAIAPDELVWNIAGAAPETASDMILWPHEDGAPNEKWFIRPMSLEVEPQPSSSQGTRPTTSVAPPTTQTTRRPSSSTPSASGSAPQITQEEPAPIPQDEGSAMRGATNQRVLGALAATMLVPLVLALVG